MQMTRFFKKLLCTVVAIGCLCSAASVSAATEPSIGDFTVQNGVLTSYNGADVNLTIPDGVVSIGSQAFKNRTSLKSVTIPDSVKSIGDSAFYGCSSLAAVNLPAQLRDFGYNAFYATAWLSGYAGSFVTAGDGVLISYKGSDTTVNIPDDVKVIGAGAFENNPTITGVTIPSGVEAIEAAAFRNCAKLSAVSIPGSVEAVGDYAFYSCGAMTGAVFGNGVKSIGARAFSYCYKLSSVTVPASMSSIGGNAFYETPWYKNYSGDYVVVGNGLLIGYKGVSTSVYIPSTVKTICDSAFYDCESISYLSIPYGVTSIEDYAFYYCVSLKNLTIPSSVTKIGKMAFKSCYSLISAVIPTSVLSIGDYAFDGCTGLTNLSMAGTVEHIGVNAFNNTAWLNNYTGDFVVAGDGILISYRGKAASVQIPSSVKRIGVGAFNGRSFITGVVMPSGLIEIGPEAFAGCTSLLAVVMPSGVVNVESGAFRNCTALKSLTLNDGLSEIGEGAFENCRITGLLWVPGSVKEIGYRAFSGCSKITSLTFGADMRAIMGEAFSGCASLAAVEFKGAVSFIGYRAFFGCSVLADVFLKSDLNALGFGAFYGCSKLKTLNIPRGLKKVAAWTFAGCSSLNRVAISSEVEIIDDRAFEGCPAFRVFCYPNTYARSFATANAKPCTLYAVSVTGTVEFGQELTAALNETLPEAVPVYTWKSAGVPVGTGQTHVVAAGDMGKPLTVTVTAFIGGDKEWEVTSIGVIPAKITQPAADKPVLKSKTWDTVELIQQPGVLYKVNNSAWQSSAVFTGLKPNTQYIFYARYAETVTQYAGPPSAGLTVRTEKGLIQGDISLIGTPEYNARLGVNLGSLTPEGATVTYQWVLNGEPAGSGDTYTVTAADIGKTLKVVLTGIGNYTGTVESPPATVMKAAAAKPAAPVLLSKTGDSVTLVAAAGYEYKIEGGSWQAGGVFGSLAPNKEYRFYARSTENALYMASAESDPLLVRTDGLPIYGSVSIMGSAVYGETLLAREITILPEGATYELLWVRDTAVVASGDAYTVTVQDIGRSLTVQLSGTGDYEGTVSSAPVVPVKATVTQVPETLQVLNVTATSVTFEADERYEYRLRGEVWQSSPVFTGLSPNTTYEFRFRLAETATHFASPKTVYIGVTTKQAVSGITLSETTLLLKPGQKAALSAEVVPATAYDTSVTWSSDRADIAAVDSNGTVTANRAGNAVITCLANDGSGVKAVCRVSVVPVVPENLQASVTYDSVRLTWGAVQGVGGYEIYRLNPNGETVVAGTTATTSFTDTKLSCGSTYTYKVRAYEDFNGTRVYGEYSTAVTATPMPSVPGNFRANRWLGRNVRLRWSAVAGANGYEVFRAESETGEFTRVKRTIFRFWYNLFLSSDKTYFYKVRAYRNVNGVKVYGDFTEVKSVNIN